MTQRLKFITFIFIFFLTGLWVAAKFFLPQLSGVLKNLFYWMELFFILSLILVFNLPSGFTLYTAFFITILGAVLHVIPAQRFDLFAETILRIGLVFWLVGVVQVLVELNRKRRIYKKRVKPLSEK